MVVSFVIYLKKNKKRKILGDFPPFGLTIETYNAASTTRTNSLQLPPEPQSLRNACFIATTEL